MQRDKIFENNFESPDFEMQSNISFELDPSYKSNLDEDLKIHYEMIANKIHELINVSRFNVFNKVNDLGQCKNLKKSDINDVYGYIISEMANTFSRIDLFSELCVYFDIKPDKFYNSLSNVYKEDLVQELDLKTGILESKNINKLF
jgi:ferritin-like protein